MRMTKLFGRRQRESARGAESISHDLLLRAGYVRQHAAGIYSFLSPALRSLRRIEGIIREEMDATGAQEILMSVVQSAGPWKATGRYSAIDATLVRFRDRRDHDMVLGMTHEEIVAELAASEIASYRQAGIVVYQIQTKFRDELRPRGGLLRTREFVMKDAYSLDVDAAGLERAYESQSRAYSRIFRRVGLRDVRIVRSATGDMGGRLAHEFSVPHANGEDVIGLCGACGDALNLELAIGTGDARSDGDVDCPRCGAALERRRAIEVGNIFQLGTGYAEALGARITTRDGTSTPLVMGSYGIGVTRLLAALVEQHHDDAGIALPAAVAPFDVHMMTLSAANGEAVVIAQELETALTRAGLEVLYDDRDARAGEKLAEADLIGASLRVVIADRSRVEVRERGSGRVHEMSADAAGDGIVRISHSLRATGGTA